MSRRTTAKKRLVSPDPIYRSRLVSMIMSRLLQDGKKSLARRLFYESMEKVEQMTEGTTKNEGAGASSAAPQKLEAKLGTEQKMANGGKVSRSPENKAEQSSRIQANKVSSTDTTLESSGSQTSSLKIFQQAVLNVTPVVEVKSRRVGGSNYQVPLEVNSERGTALALRWLVQAARQRPGREMAMKLASEFIDASNKTGNAIRKREETHRMAEANKAFANYRF